MFVTVTLDAVRREGGAVIPRSAVQTVGARQVVYVAIDESRGRFEERPVELGDGDADRVSVTTGLAAGERIVTAGSFSIRAEFEPRAFAGSDIAHLRSPPTWVTADLRRGGTTGGLSRMP